jgi:hypothetical protein
MENKKIKKTKQISLSFHKRMQLIKANCKN